MALAALKWILVGNLISLNGIACLFSVTENDLKDNSQSLPYATSEKMFSVLRDILNQESIVRLSMVQKIQKLMMDTIDNKNITETLMKRLDDLTQKNHALETMQQKMEEETFRLYDELKTIRSTIGDIKNLTSAYTHSLNKTEISLLRKEASSLRKEIRELTLENTKIKAHVRCCIKPNKTNSESGAICEQLKQEIEQIKEQDLDGLKNDTLLLSKNYVGLSHENENMQKLFQMNKTINENRNSDDFNARLQMVEGNFITFAAFVNRTIGSILEDQDNTTRNLLSISTRLSEILLSPPILKSIAFYAYMSQNTPTISVQYSLTFDVVKTNDGYGYHSPTGVFIVPETGIYLFTWTIRVHSNVYHSTQLMVNTNELGIIRTHVSHGSDFVGTGIVVAHVNSEDNVFVRTHSSWNNGVIYSDVAGRSSFAGWKLS